MLIDLHCDTILRIISEGGKLNKNGYHIDIEKMKKGESLAQFFAMFVNLEETDAPFKRCLDMIDIYNREIKENNEYINFAYSHNDIITNEIAGKMSSILTIEEGGVLEGDIKRLRLLYNLGVRSITLTWNFENEIGCPNSGEIHSEKGLKPFGIEVVKEMNRLGMLIDVSHLSDKGFYDCIRNSSMPIIASHSNARGVCYNSRNLTDDMIKALDLNGGVMGMNIYGYFLNSTDKSYVSDVIKHIKYIRDLVGVNVIAIGTDYDGIMGELEMHDISKINLLKEGLIEEKFTVEEIDKIFYKNALRVIDRVL